MTGGSSFRDGECETPARSVSGIDRSDLPPPEKVADELARISRDLDHELKDREHAYLNAADHYLRTVDTDAEQGGSGQ